MQFAYGHTTEYLYDAAGVKHSVKQTTVKDNLLVPMGSTVAVPADKVAITNQTDYCGNMIYEDGNLKMILTDEGYIDMSTGSPQYCYYIKDHQGNNRVVENQAGVVLQSNHYYPFGMTFGEGITSSNQRYKYNGKELDRMHGLDLYDYGARMYDSAIGRWGTMDPLAEKYYNISPYAYCGNNPVKFIDSDGKEVRFAKGSSEEFRRNVTLAVAALNQHGIGELFGTLEASKTVYYISQSSDKYSSFDPNSNTIIWDPKQAMLTNNGVEISPTTIFNHELDHAVRHDTDAKQQAKDQKTADKDYKNKEEKRVIQGSEQKTAKALGEIKNNEETRTDHSGTLYETLTPTSIIRKNEIIVMPDLK